MDASASTFPQEPFWTALAQGRFLLPRCDACGGWLPAGAWRCHACDGTDLVWTDATGRGEVYSLMERLPVPNTTGPVIAIAVVQLEEGPRMMGTVLGAPGAVRVGTLVCARLSAAPEAHGLPTFAPVGTDAPLEP